MAFPPTWDEIERKDERIKDLEDSLRLMVRWADKGARLWNYADGAPYRRDRATAMALLGETP